MCTSEICLQANWNLVSEPFYFEIRIQKFDKNMYKEFKNAYSMSHDMRCEPIANMLHKAMRGMNE